MNSSQQSQPYWFDDGNVVIEVETNRHKLHKSQLSRHCKAFKTLFEGDEAEVLSASTDEAGFVRLPDLDGCPVYRIDTLTDLDFREFLGALLTPF